MLKLLGLLASLGLLAAALFAVLAGPVIMMRREPPPECLAGVYWRTDVSVVPPLKVVALDGQGEPIPCRQ